MYVTRPLSSYKTNPSALSLPPPEGPNSGILVIQEDEAETTCCFGFCKVAKYVRDLPFPQNMNLTASYDSGVGKDKTTDYNHLVFIPLLDHPLSANRYYVIEQRGRYKGEAHASVREEDMKTCCFCCRIYPSKPVGSLDPKDIYQQFKINKCRFGFAAESVAPDGVPPIFLGRRGWNVTTSTITEFELGEAPGLNARLRATLPNFDFPLSQQTSSPVVVGKWYTPFMFIKEGTIEDQIKRCRYYEVTLEQRWERVFAGENSLNEGGNNNNNNAVNVDTAVGTEAVGVAGKEAVAVDGGREVDGAIWFRSSGGGGSVGLSLAVMARMRWEEERGGWVGGGRGEARVRRVEEYGGEGMWRKFGCYMLVERFVVKRLDGTLVFHYDFMHTHNLRTKWES